MDPSLPYIFSKDFFPIWGWRFEFSFPSSSVRVFSLTVGSHAVGLSPYSAMVFLFCSFL